MLACSLSDWIIMACYAWWRCIRLRACVLLIVVCCCSAIRTTDIDIDDGIGAAFEIDIIMRISLGIGASFSLSCCIWVMAL